MVRIGSLLCACLLMLVLWGCGGSSSFQSSIISGVAASGAPITGSVTLWDKSGTQVGPVPIDLDGHYTLDVIGLTAPFLLKATTTDDMTIPALYAISTTTGTVNINPFTHLMVGLAVQRDPATLVGVNGHGPDLPAFSSTDITASQVAVNGLLRQVLTLYGDNSGSDFLHGSYRATADNTIDALLDLVAVTISGDSVTITNSMNGVSFVSGTITSLLGWTYDLANMPPVTRLADLRGIYQMLEQMRLVMNSGDNLTLALVDPLYLADPNYGTSAGRSRAEDMAGFITFFGPDGTNINGPLYSIRNVRLTDDVTSLYYSRGVDQVYQLQYDFVHTNGAKVISSTVTIGQETGTGLWKFIGEPPGYSLGGNSGYTITSTSISIGTISETTPDFLAVEN